MQIANTGRMKHPIGSQAIHLDNWPPGLWRVEGYNQRTDGARMYVLRSVKDCAPFEVDVVLPAVFENPARWSVTPPCSKEHSA